MRIVSKTVTRCLKHRAILRTKAKSHFDYGTMWRKAGDALSISKPCFCLKNTKCTDGDYVIEILTLIRYS